MFAVRYFPEHYFARTYFSHLGAAIVANICSLDALQRSSVIEVLLHNTEVTTELLSTTIDVEITCHAHSIVVPSTYHAKAVHFDGLSFLRNASLACTDSPYVAFSVWLFCNSTSTWPVIYVTDSENLYNNTAYFNDLGRLYTDVADADVTGTPPFNSVEVNALIPPALGAWHHFLAAYKASAPTKLAALYVDDVSVGTRADGGTFFVPPMDGLSFWIGNDSFGDGYIGDMADFWFASGVNLIESDETISEVNRRRFISTDKKPVDPVNFPSGGSVLLSGDASSFANNQLPGGSFILSGALNDAATSPSD